MGRLAGEAPNRLTLHPTTYRCWVCNRSTVVDSCGHYLSPRSRHRCARRQRGVTRIVTACAVNFAGYQMVIYKFRLDLYGRMAILPNHHRAITKHIAAVAGRMAIRLAVSRRSRYILNVFSFSDRFVRHLRRRNMESYPRFRRLRHYVACQRLSIVKHLWRLLQAFRGNRKCLVVRYILLQKIYLGVIAMKYCRNNFAARN